MQGQENLLPRLYGGTCDFIVIIVRNGHGDWSSNSV